MKRTVFDILRGRSYVDNKNNPASAAARVHRATADKQKGKANPKNYRPE